MEAGPARLARHPGKRDEFLLCLYMRNFHPACRDNFVILILLLLLFNHILQR
jgi:hypothetical protein